MWRTIVWSFPTFDYEGVKSAGSKQKAWIKRHGHNNQWHEVFVNNGLAIEYRPLRTIA